MLALGAAIIVTVAVVITAEQPPDAASVKLTVYVPSVLVLGVTVHKVALKVKPVGLAL